MPLDDKDRQLLALLQKNARQTTSELARRMGLSRTTVKDRIARLEQRQVITGYTLRCSDIDARSIRAQALIIADPKHNAAIIRQMKAIDAVQTVYAVSGIYDFIVEISADSTQTLDQSLDKIGNIEGVEKTLSSIILSTKFTR